MSPRRLEQLAEPGGICVSGKVHDEVEGKIAVPLEEHGEYQVKNISRPVRVFAARLQRCHAGWRHRVSCARAHGAGEDRP